MLEEIRNDRKKELYEMVKVSPLGVDRYVLLEDFKFYDVVVPAGYETNGADVPRLLWAIFPPNRSNYLPAVILHDYLTDMELYKKADIVFDRALKELIVNKITHFCLLNAVKTYHLIRYRTPW